MSKNSNNQKQKDEELKAKIEKAINSEKDFSGYDINVRVVDEHVTIYGVVDVLAGKNHANNVVESIEGVKEVENNLTISTDGQIYDGHIHMEVRQEIDGDPRLDDASIKISLRKGKAILEGEAKTLAQKQAAEKAASKAKGVTKVINKISVNNEENLDDASIVNEIRRHFSNEGIGDRLEVTCHDGKVKITGIADKEEKKKSKELALQVPGVKNVSVSEINTRLGELDHSTAAAEKVKNAFLEDETLEELPIEIYEEEGHLVLDGIIDNTSQKRKIDQTLNSFMEEYGQDLVAVENKIRLRQDN